MAGKPRMAGARAALGYFGVPDEERRVERSAAAKQEHVVALIKQGRFRAFPDALRFILAVKDAGIAVAAASSSKNARLFLERIRLDTFAAEQRVGYEFVHGGMTLEQLFDVDISGRDFPRGKPDPMIFLTAAGELHLPPDACFVIEDATSGVQAAKAGGMSAIGVARLGDHEMLAGAGRRPGGDHLGRHLGAGAERGPAGRTRTGRRDPPPAHGAAAGHLDAGVPRLRPRPSGATQGALLAGQRVLRHPGCPARGQGRRRQLPGHLRRRPVQPAGQRRRRTPGRERGPGEPPELAGLQTEFTAENWTGTLDVRSGLDGTVVNAAVQRYRDLDGRHLRTLGQGEVDHETVGLQVETTQSRVQVALAARTRLLQSGQIAEAERRLVEEPGFVAHQLTVRLEQGRPATVEKIVALYTSRDRAISESRHDAALAAAAADDFAGLLARHQSAWASAWNRFDIELDSANEWTETVLHMHIFHLLQTVSLHTEHLDAGVPARGWNGEAYRGHIFWDEMFVFPFLNFQRPTLASTLLEYRIARLGAARAAGRAAAFAGAMFPWQSGSTGREETQQLHLNPKSGRWLPITRTCSVTSTSRSPTTCGSTTWSPGTSVSFVSAAPSC
jgi:beta-phosphoglucomutase-like phosphatase (HAD superfamily)